jgi:PilZ domain.
MTERRQAFRMPALPDFDQVVVKVRGREVAAKLCDTSLNGLSVVCKSEVQVRVGERIEVSSDSGWFFVKVVRVTATPDGPLLGLERQMETAEAAQARRDESRLLAVIFAIVVIALPLLTAARAYWLPVNPPAPQVPLPSLATAPDKAPANEPVRAPEAP